jgi:hypothetical protein
MVNGCHGGYNIGHPISSLTFICADLVNQQGMETRDLWKTAVSWDVTPFSVVEVHLISEIPANSIINYHDDGKSKIL